MRLGPDRSSNVEDRRGGFGLPVVGGGIGAVVIALIALFFRGTPGDVTQNTGPDGGTAGPQYGQPADAGQPGQTGTADPNFDFVARVLKSTEDTWQQVFRDDLGRNYQDPKLVVFTDAVQSACGVAESSSGPFYCPEDHKLYIDLGFYQELKDRFKAPGDFAQAYVVAHEVGHHVQNLLGISNQVQSAMRNAGSKREVNAISVAQELQADCYAGIWANRADAMNHILENGDVEEGLNAASAIGDDRLQRETRGRVVPDSFTHGSSAQRVKWFRRGLQSGKLNDCDTFNAPAL